LRLTFLTPLAAFVAVAGLLPLAALGLAVRRAERVRRVLGLAPAALRARVLPASALVVAAALLGLAAAQPVLERDTKLRVRSDAEVFVIVDVSRSMLARTDAESPERLERAKDAAVELRESLSGVRVGIASLTDRVLPHLFPSPNEETFRRTLRGALGVERPPPRETLSANATSLEALTALANRHFFSPAVAHRVAVVLTDGESRPLDELGVAASLRRTPAVGAVFVQFWDARERVYTQGLPEPEYEPDRSARARLERIARLADGGVYSENELGAAARKIRELLGDGPSVVERDRRERRPLAPFLTAAAFLPLALVLLRRRC
jgi:VWA domain-containing protein